jgi:alpha-beta hydrolase superfamily lysophospholipase
MAFFRFDHRGVGDSQGPFAEVTSVQQRRRDVLDAVVCLRKRTDLGNRTGLFGSSMGGAVCLSAAADITPQAIVVNAAPIRSLSAGIQPPQPSDSRMQGLPSGIRQAQFDLGPKLKGLSHVLVIHGDKDTVVPVSHAHEIFRRVDQPKRLLIQKRGDHLMSSPQHQKAFVEIAARWFYYHLMADSDDPEMP